MVKPFLTVGAIAVCVLLFGTLARAQNAAGDPSPDPSPQTAEAKADEPADAPSPQASDQPPPAVRKVRNFIEKSLRNTA